MKTGDATPFCQLKALHQTVIVKRDTQSLSTAGPFVFIRVHSWFPTAWIRLRIQTLVGKQNPIKHKKGVTRITGQFMRSADALIRAGTVANRPVRSHYQIEVGKRGDGRYLEGWHDAEPGGRPARWSRSSSWFLLPVIPGKRYTLTAEANVPQHALSAEA